MKFCLRCTTPVEKETCPQCGCREKHEWVIHYVNNEVCGVCSEENTKPISKNAEVNIHTHGLFENYDHLDIQVSLPLQPKIICGLINDLGFKIKDGQKFSHGQRFSELIQNMDVVFYEARDGERKVLRLIIPDEKGNLERNKMNKDYQNQFWGLTPTLIC